MGSLTGPIARAMARLPRPASEFDEPVTADEAAPPPVVVVGQNNPEDEPGTVPDGMRVAAGWAWRLIVLGAFAYFLFKGLNVLREVMIPLVVSLLLTAVFWPLRDSLVRRRVRPGFAALVCLLALALVVLGILALVSLQIATQWGALSTEAVNSFNQLVNWMQTGPFHVTNTQMDRWLHQATDYVSRSQSKIAGYATEVGAQVSHFFAGLALALFALFYFLYDGRRLADAGSVLIPRRSRARVMDAATRGWFALVAYVRAAVIVAAVDGIGALIGALALGSSMWLAIGALTFLCAFVPLIGALFSGAVAVGVVFVTLGWVKAIVMLVVFVAVLELEGHVMQPFLLGKAVSIHPLVVLYGIAIGMIVSGIVGALFMIPLLAFGNAFIRTWSAPRRRHPAST